MIGKIVFRFYVTQVAVGLSAGTEVGRFKYSPEVHAQSADRGHGGPPLQGVER